VAIKPGTAEYSDLATEDTIAALPASILPGSADAARLRTQTRGGRQVYVLDWTAAGSKTKLSEQLVLTATRQALPISETTTAGSERQTVTLGHWGERVRVPAPTGALPYQQVQASL
jgi:hypothetical protein